MHTANKSVLPKAEFPQITAFNFSEERMTRPRAANYLGVSLEFLESNVVTKRHKIPYIKVGSRVFYLKSDLDEWILAHRVEV